ncbi:MAG TPA: hypothetical protein VEF04_02935 [Blastocatellia bacterium]|nr:hypothetical protein [Blastocatellia bacterium]
MRLKKYLITLSLFTLTFPVGCSTRLYEVGSIPKAQPSDAVSSTTPKGLGISVSAIRDDDVAFEITGGNLPLAGVLAVDTRITNQTSEQIKSSSLKFELRDASGKKIKQIDSKKALKRLMKLNEIENYLVEAYHNTREDFEELALPRSFTLPPSGEVRGILFFDAKKDASQMSGLTLTVKGSGEPVTINLN